MTLSDGPNARRRRARASYPGLRPMGSVPMPQLTWDMWAYGVLAAAVTGAAVTDIRREKVPNYITYPAAAIGLVGHTLAGGLYGGDDALRLGLYGSLGGLAAGFLPLLAAWLAGGIGGGDAKLMGAVGALAGWRFAVAAMFYGFVVAAIMAGVVMIKRRIVKETLTRILRFLYLLFMPTKPADPATEESPKIPFALALCIGSAAALIEAIWRGPVAAKLMLGL